ncbi:MAG: prepilin peptidase, partial [Minisyncoccia bacterium]
MLFTTLLMGALGAVLGSFIGVVGERAYTGQSFLSGRSRCNSCRRELGVLDLIPILSWSLSLGKCRSCGSKVPGLYLLLEASLALLFA